jgi:hypothetical protein
VIHDEEMGRRGVNRLGVTGFALGLASVVVAQFLRVVGVHWWGFALFVGEVTALACAGVAVARLPRCDHCRHPIRDSLLTVTLPTGVTRYHLDRPCADAAPPERTPAFPGGRGCEPGCCPICGMDDPMGLEPCWGGQKAHQDCADWLGREPAVGGITMTEASADLLAATERLRQGFPTRGGYNPGGIILPPGCTYTPTPPPGPGAATKAESAPSAWEQYRAQGREIKEIAAEVRALKANADALPPVPDLPPLHVDPLLIRREKR